MKEVLQSKGIWKFNYIFNLNDGEQHEIYRIKATY
jgi:hypothetical protein